MSCDSARLRLLAYAHGELEEDASRQIARHVAGCPACARELRCLERESESLVAALRLEAPPDLEAKVHAQLQGLHIARRRSSLDRLLVTLLRTGTVAAASLAMALAGLSVLAPASYALVIGNFALLGSRVNAIASANISTWPNLVRAAGVIGSLLAGK